MFCCIKLWCLAHCDIFIIFYWYLFILIHIHTFYLHIYLKIILYIIHNKNNNTICLIFENKAIAYPSGQPVGA
jgi:hypothetical protein